MNIIEPFIIFYLVICRQKFFRANRDYFLFDVFLQLPEVNDNTSLIQNNYVPLFKIS